MMKKELDTIMVIIKMNNIYNKLSAEEKDVEIYEKHLIEELKKAYDYIFIDTPPIGLVTDAGVLASFIDGTVLVVKSEGVEMKHLEEAKKKLDSVNAKIIGAVLNSYKAQKNDYYYYSYYGER